MASIFISYRRDDAGGHAGRMCDRLGIGGDHYHWQGWVLLMNVSEHREAADARQHQIEDRQRRRALLQRRKRGAAIVSGANAKAGPPQHPQHHIHHAGFVLDQ